MVRAYESTAGMRRSAYPSRGRRSKLSPRFILFILFSAVLVLSATMLILDGAQGAREESAFKKLAAIASDGMASKPASSGTPGAAKVPKAPAVLAQYQALHDLNADMAGWVKIDGTAIDYPVMYTPDDGEFYLTHGFDKEKSRSGVPFIDKRCPVEPLGTNTIIYGHHMKNGTMFASLDRYKDEAFFKEHPAIRFNTLYKEQEYAIVAVFESRIYGKDDTAFKHYNFLDAGNEADFKDYLTNIKALALYDTGVAAKYGDVLITLVTCGYQTENGQFVVVAKKL